MTSNRTFLEQSGVITPGHVAVWVSNSIVKDGGPPGPMGSTQPIIAGPLTINGTDAEPSLTFTQPVGIELKGTNTGTALVFGISDTNPFPSWIQGRNWLFDAQSLLMLQPAGGGLLISSNLAGLAAGLNQGIQLHSAEWLYNSIYEPDDPIPFALGGLNIFVDSGSGATNESGGLTVKARTDNAPFDAATIAVGLYVYANATAARGAWPIYSEGHRMSLADYTYGLGECAAVNRNSVVLEINPFNVPAAGIGGASGLVLESGNSRAASDYVQYSCSVGMFFQLNAGPGQAATNKGFAHGIVFRWPTLDQSLFDPPDAIALAGNTSRYAISWWADGTTRAWLIYSDATSGANTLALHNTVATFSSAIKPQSATVAGVPSASTAGAGAMIYVSNEAGGAVPAFSDGSNWRRVTDRAIIS